MSSTIYGFCFRLFMFCIYFHHNHLTEILVDRRCIINALIRRPCDAIEFQIYIYSIHIDMCHTINESVFRSHKSRESLWIRCFGTREYRIYNLCVRIITSERTYTGRRKRNPLVTADVTKSGVLLPLDHSSCRTDAERIIRHPSGGGFERHT